MHNKIGVMQGRLLPKYQGRYQAFPIGMWQDEFQVAKDCNLDLIQFLLDFNDVEDNPLLKSEGIDEIIKMSKSTGVSVKSICADYFMKAPLHSGDDKVAEASFKILENLLEAARILKITDIIIPCVDQGSLENEIAVDRFVGQIAKIIPTLERDDINISLETNLEPKSFTDLLSKLNSKNITVNYDIGNSASLGYDLLEELDAYGDRISGIHIKDRRYKGASVVLGEGDANFELFFKTLKKYNYKNPFIMEAYRDEEGIDVFNKQLKWIKELIKKVEHE